MRYYLLLVMILLKFSLSAQKLVKVRKKLDPPGIARITSSEVIAGTKLETVGFKPSKLHLSFRILETDSSAIQLHLMCQLWADVPAEKGWPFEIGFTDSSKIVLKALRDEPTTGGPQHGYYVHGYFDLDKATQQLFISKRVKYIKTISANYPIDVKRNDMIGKALLLFR